MNSTRRPLVWLIAFLLCSALAQAQGNITEEYVVRGLRGENQGPSAEGPLGFAFTVTLLPPSRETPTAAQQATEGKAGLDEEFYKKLIPVGRALESDALRDCRYEIAVQADAQAPEEREQHLALRVAETIHWFLTTYFAIAPERFSISQTDPLSPRIKSSAADAKSPWRWRVEIRVFDR
jgi:hypothetical protein